MHVALPSTREIVAVTSGDQQSPGLISDRTVRLGNRVHQQLWRYYPQIAKITDDIAASWFLELWSIAPTPSKARRLHKSTIEQLLKQHRIRRIDAETVLRTLREPVINVGEGVAEAAGIQRQDIMILRSIPGIGRINLASSFQKLRALSAAVIIQRSEHYVVPIGNVTLPRRAAGYHRVALLLPIYLSVLRLEELNRFDSGTSRNADSIVAFLCFFDSLMSRLIPYAPAASGTSKRSCSTRAIDRSGLKWTT